MANQDAFETADVVEFYARMKGLQKPERAILDCLQARLPEMRMLDIGVGAGRTTPDFAGRAAHYVGIDSSAAMIECCRRQFASFRVPVSFAVGDVCDLREFEDGSFDFVLFSFNGIDYLAPQDRLRAYDQIRRVVRPGGVLALSTHNLRTLTGLPSWPRLPAHPLDMARTVARYVYRTYRNLTFRHLRGQTYAVVQDGLHEGRVMTYYILPEEQRQQLTDAGFDNVRIFDLEGTELSQAQRLEAVKDAWLYFLCEAR